MEEKVRDNEGNTRKEYLLRLCHISNETPYDKRDTLYPNHLTELDIARIYTGKLNLSKVPLKGLDGSYFYLSGNSILWMESKASHTLIHTIDKVYESTERLANVAEKYADTICKVHESFAVNPLYITETGRFYVKMQDGKQISIPEKRYTAIKSELHRRMKS